MLQQDTDYLSLCALQFASPLSYAYESAYQNMIVGRKSSQFCGFPPDEFSFMSVCCSPYLNIMSLKKGCGCTAFQRDASDTVKL